MRRITSESKLVHRSTPRQEQDCDPNREGDTVGEHIQFLSKTVFIFVAMLFVIVSACNGQLLSETFDYAAGNLVPNGGWTEGPTSNPPEVVNGNLDFGSDAGTGRRVRLDAYGDYPYKALSSTVSSGSVYAKFLVNVTGYRSGYFFHFETTTGVEYGRVRLRPAAAGGDFRFALNVRSTANAHVQYPSRDYSYGTTYLIVLKYTFGAGADDDTASLFIFESGVDAFPATEPSATVTSLTTGAEGETDAADIGRIGIRNYDLLMDLYIDEIEVRTSWEAGLPVDLLSFSVH